MLDIPALFDQYHIQPRGVIHIGAHDGDEVEMYVAMGFKRILLIEAHPAIYTRLIARYGNRPGVIAVNSAIGNIDGWTKFFTASNDQCGSVLAMKDHRELYPQIVAIGELNIPMARLDTVMGQGLHDHAG